MSELALQLHRQRLYMKLREMYHEHTLHEIDRAKHPVTTPDKFIYRVCVFGQWGVSAQRGAAA